MKAISLKAAGRAVSVREIVSATGTFLKGHSVAIAVIGAVATYIGILAGSDPLTYSAAFVALGFVRLSIPEEKGGDA